MPRSESAYSPVPPRFRHPYYETAFDAQRREPEPLGDLLRECAEFDALRARLAHARVHESAF